MASVSNEYRYQAISLYKRIDSLLGNEKQPTLHFYERCPMRIGRQNTKETMYPKLKETF